MLCVNFFSVAPRLTDLPMPRLSELFNINHFIVSQACVYILQEQECNTSIPPPPLSSVYLFQKPSSPNGLFFYFFLSSFNSFLCSLGVSCFAQSFSLPSPCAFWFAQFVFFSLFPPLSRFLPLSLIPSYFTSLFLRNKLGQSAHCALLALTDVKLAQFFVASRCSWVLGGGYSSHTAACGCRMSAKHVGMGAG